MASFYGGSEKTHPELRPMRPRAHEVQTVLMGRAKVPAPHVVQLVAPVAAPYVPAPHSAHEAAAAAEYVPRGQTAQAPPPEWRYLPALHSVQAAAAGAE